MAGYRKPTRKDVRPTLALVPLQPNQLAELNEEDKHAEAWLLRCQGRTQVEIAEHFGVSRVTIQNWHKLAVHERRRRCQDVDTELERCATVIEHVMTRALRAFEAADPDSLAAPNYLRLTLDGAKEILRLRGLDKATVGGDAAGGATEIVVEIGGETKARVGVRRSS